MSNSTAGGSAKPHHVAVQQYKSHEVNRTLLAQRCEEQLGKKPFDWQLDACVSILCGEDIILDVGTGNGKTLVFSLPLLMDPKDVNIIVSPLSALMIDQARSSPLPTVPVCRETIAEAGSKDRLFESIVSGSFRQVIVSPEIVTSAPFRAGVLSKTEFTDHLRAVCIDEAHCVSLWGGSFRPDYAELGVLRARLPPHVVMMIASATLPDHILDDIRRRLSITKDARLVALSNDRPNIALSVRVMKHPEESKADLRFLIPDGASGPNDIPITLVYVNERNTTEDIVDRLRQWAEDAGLEDPSSFIVFYHAKIGTDRKREIEEELRKGNIRIAGCDMRNIDRVILWGLPPSFCALVQRGGRAGRDFTVAAEAILIVTPATMKKGVTEAEILTMARTTVEEDEAENRNEDELEVLQEQGITVGEGNVLVSVREDVGTRVSRDTEEEEVSSTKKGKRKRVDETFHSQEAESLNLYLCPRCRHATWNEAFKNRYKIQLNYPSTTTYKPIPNMRCCDVCSPELFPVEEIDLEQRSGLARGRKKEHPKSLATMLRSGLMDWREDTLVEAVYSSQISIISGDTLLTDVNIDQIITSGVRIKSANELQRYTRWPLGFDSTGQITEAGRLLLNQLTQIYFEHDLLAAAGELPPETPSSDIPVAESSQQSRGRGRAGRRGRSSDRGRRGRGRRGSRRAQM